MPGRQSHGRSLLGKSQAKAPKRANQKSKSKARAHALDAFAIAGKQVQPERMTRRGRDLELDPEKDSRGGKHRRDEDDEDDEEDEDEDEAPRKKRPRQTAADDGSDDENDGGGIEGGSDSEGHEWHVGVNSEDDDSEIESDEAFGESDDEKFDGYTFRGGRAQKKRKGGESSEEEDDNGDDGESLGSDAIDLADALMQSSDDDDEGSQGDTESGSDEEDSESESATSSDDDDDDDDDVEADPAKLMELQKLFKSYADTDNKDDEGENGPPSKQAISLQGLGLSNLKDPSTKKGLKLLKKEERAESGKEGTSKKLDVPLARRQQDQLDRVAAYEKTNETLDRWNDTVKQNRRADHLMFPLPDTLADAGLDNGELLPLTKKTAGTELEQTIMSIMEESGLGPSGQSQKQQDKTDANGEEQTISRSELKDLWAQRRKDREIQSREQKRAKRIKKIKSKTYRRVHRKERLGEEAKQHEEMRANGEIDSEDEREAAARRRALERVGAKHKDSKWAKMGSKVGRAAWDDDYRAGLTDMARRDEELRKRVEGRAGAGEGDEDDSDATSSSGDEDGNTRLLKELDGEDDSDEDAGPHANLMKLKFMQRAEAARKQENDGLVAEIRRDLESGSDQDDDSDAEAQVGRRSYGLPEQKKRLLREIERSTSNGAKNKAPKDGLSNAKVHTSSATDINDESPASKGPDAWSSGKSIVVERKKKKITGDRPGTDLDLNAVYSAPSKPSKTRTTSKAASASLPATSQAEDNSSDDEINLPLALQKQELADRAFAGDEVVAEFEAEKEAIISEDDEKMIDNTMPGWGSWAGEGISKRSLKRNKGKVMTKKEGIKRKDRKDAKLDRVIVNEKRNRKLFNQNEQFLASQLPHPFESRQQYERSLRLPVGPEWMTKESFQASTKPRVIVKQGIIAPMAKPTI
ncbi:hypothetical protein Daus18300_003020 [Diaporthe australafricana]|uniref:Uncharacterized protein n=1 Tax=Diaporthe australafricana TaxID=127596 RepID=A0ABR3XIT1_9PEZI